MALFQQFSSSRLGLLLMAITVWPLNGCVSYSESPEPVAQVDFQDGFTRSGVEVLPDHWWKVFGDEQLNRYVVAALSGNFSLRISYARIKQAKALRVQARAGYSPSVSAGLSGTRSEGSNEYTANLAASYEVDLWGRVRAQAKAADFDFKASEQDYRAASLSLSATVASTWYELLAAEKTLSVQQQQLEVNQNLLTLANDQFHNGSGAMADAILQAAQVEAGNAAIAQKKADIAQLKHSLNVLLGRAASEPINTHSQALPELLDLPETGIPAHVLTQRPDVRSAWLLLQAANADVAAAAANRWPSLTLSATGTSITETASELLRDWSHHLMASIAGDVWDGGAKGAVVDQKRARVEELLNDYSQLLLETIQDTEDALSHEYYLSQRVSHLAAQQRLTYRAMEQLKITYINGSSNFTELLNSIESAQSLDIELVNAQQQLIDNRIGLYRALSGGWTDEPAIVTGR